MRFTISHSVYLRSDTGGKVVFSLSPDQAVASLDFYINKNNMFFIIKYIVNNAM